jgi:hypothetical protein
MTKTLEILGADGLRQHIVDSQASLNDKRKKLEPVDRLKELWREGTSHFYRNGHSERFSFLDTAADLARQLHGAGRPAREVRALLQEGVDAYAPVVRILDFSVAEREYAVARAMAKKFDGREVNSVSGRIFRPAKANLGSGFKVIKVKVRNQPKRHEMESALIAALMAWDFAGAKKMAETYHLQPAEKGEDPNPFGLLREAVLDHRDGALAFLKNFPRGYDPDFPPKQRELAEGVVRKDAALVRAGLKSVSKRFATAWTLKTYATPARLQRLGTLESMLPEIRSHLIGHDWLLSDWAVAWMSLASHRGLKAAFSDPDLFSEWAPWELCGPEPPPQTRAH